jgi:hypothetical protein
MLPNRHQIGPWDWSVAGPTFEVAALRSPIRWLQRTVRRLSALTFEGNLHLELSLHDREVDAKLGQLQPDRAEGVDEAK